MIINVEGVKTELEFIGSLSGRDSVIRIGRDLGVDMLPVECPELTEGEYHHVAGYIELAEALRSRIAMRMCPLDTLGKFSLQRELYKATHPDIEATQIAQMRVVGLA